MSKIKYTNDGKKVLVVGKLNADQHIVQEIFISGGNEIPSGENFVVSSLHDAPAESWKEKNLRELEKRYESRKAELEKKLADVNGRLGGLIEKAKLRASALFKFERNNFEDHEIDTLINFISGDVRYFFIGTYDPKIVSWDDDELYQIDRWNRRTKIEALKLVSLYGGSDGRLSYRIHDYKDGSGGSKEIVPFQDYQSALEYAQNILNDIAAEFVKTGKGLSNIEKWSAIKGIKVPEDALEKHREQQDILRKSRIDKLKQEIKKLEEES